MSNMDFHRPYGTELLRLAIEEIDEGDDIVEILLNLNDHLGLPDLIRYTYLINKYFDYNY